MTTYKEALVTVIRAAEVTANTAGNSELNIRYSAVEMAKAIAVLRLFTDETPSEFLAKSGNLEVSDDAPKDPASDPVSGSRSPEDMKAAHGYVPLVVDPSHNQTNVERSLRGDLARIVSDNYKVMRMLDRCGYPNTTGTTCVLNPGHRGEHEGLHTLTWSRSSPNVWRVCNGD